MHGNLLKSRGVYFDKYQRYYCAARLFEHVRTDQSMRILDIGGSGSLLKKFLPKDKIFVLDLAIVSETNGNPVVGNAVEIPMQDNSVDICCGLDFLEHVPEDYRLKVLSEIKRVSKNFVYLSGPLYSKEILEADRLVNRFYKTITGYTYPFLDEHEKFGLPSSEFLEKWFTANEISFTRFQFLSLGEWIVFMTFFMIADFSRDIFNQLDYFNNKTMDVTGITWNPAHAYITGYIGNISGSHLPNIKKLFRSVPGSGKNHQLSLDLAKLIAKIMVYCFQRNPTLELKLGQEQDSVKSYIKKLEKEITDRENQIKKSKAYTRSLENLLKEAKIYSKELESEINAKNIELEKAGNHINKLERMIREHTSELKVNKSISAGNILPGIKLEDL